jgi:hypothetical protein
LLPAEDLVLVEIALQLLPEAELLGVGQPEHLSVRSLLDFKEKSEARVLGLLVAEVAVLLLLGLLQ